MHILAQKPQQANTNNRQVWAGHGITAASEENFAAFGDKISYFDR